MKNINSILTTIVLTAIIAITGVLTFLDNKPRINAVGEYALWNTPNNTSFNGYQSYAQIEVRNVGDAVATGINLQTPFDGIYSLDEGNNTKEFKNDIALEDLNPGDFHAIEIWSRNSLPRYYLNKTIVTHTRGTANVDFGYQTKGIIGNISKILDELLFVVIIIGGFIIFALIAYVFELKQKIKSKI